MGFFSSSSKQSPPSWTTGSFPGAVQLQAAGYSYAYSPSPVWQAQPVMAVPQYSVPVVSFQASPPVQAPVQYVSVSPQMTVSSPMLPQGATCTVVHPSIVATPITNALSLQQVPSPRIPHAIPVSPRRSPRPLAPPPPPAPESMYVVSVPAQPQGYPQQQQQQGQSSPFNLSIYFNATPQQMQTPLPGGSPAPAIAPVIPQFVSGLEEVPQELREPISR